MVTLKGRDNFNSEYLYDVSVKNLSSDPLVGESLIIVLDKITNIGGDEWMAGTSESNLTRMEILGRMAQQTTANLLSYPSRIRSRSALLQRK